MNYSARDIARTLLAGGVRPVTVAEARDYDQALSSMDQESRLAAMVIRAAERELGLEITDPDAKLLDYREADFLTDLLGPDRVQP